jgi:uncharacterized protein YbcV (DUF1398 family)
MDKKVADVIDECTIGSDEERLSFPQVVMMLNEVGVERYHTDMQRAEKTYYMPNGESRVVPMKAIKPAQAFSAAGVEAAVRAIQAGKIQYIEFCDRIAAAGCVDYVVSLAGRRAIYFGRTGDSHVEPFPAAK